MRGGTEGGGEGGRERGGWGAAAGDFAGGPLRIAAGFGENH